MDYVIPEVSKDIVVSESNALNVPPNLWNEIKTHCRNHFILPVDLFRYLSGQSIRQPFLIDPEAVNGNSQKERYLAVLAYLCRHSPLQFEAAVRDFKGHSRRIFAPTREDIEKTGRCNIAAQIGETGWWVAVNMSAYSKMNRIHAVMRRMGFTDDYAYAVGWYPSAGEFRLRD